jgi:TatD DNase family protein
MIDTHAHLDALRDPTPVVSERARAAGVERVLTVGTNIDSCRAALAAADADPNVFAILGIHPHEAGGREAERVGELVALLSHERVVAVGETGLDFYRDYAPRRAQRKLFRRQLDAAQEVDKPVVIHSRAADRELAHHLARFAGRVVLHCFSSPALLETALERSYYVSFAGNVTYPKASDLRDAATRVPADRILVETDSPYLSPQPRRGRPNEPANVVHTLEALAAVRAEGVQELAARIDANAREVFALP